MRRLRNRVSLSQLIVWTILAGGLAGIISGVWPTLGIILTILGVIGSLWEHFGSKVREREVDSFFEAQAILLAKKGIGNIYTEAGDKELEKGIFTKKAIERYQKALEIDPNDQQALRMLGIVFSLQLGKAQWLRRGKGSEFEATLAAAKGYARMGKQIAPQDHSFYDTLGILYDIEGNHEQARIEFRKSGTLRSDPFWHLLMATSWGMSGQHEEELAEVRKAIKEGANDRIVAFDYGRALNEVGDYVQALPWLRKALKGHEWDYKILVCIKDAYYFQGYLRKAAKYDALCGLIVLLAERAPFLGAYYLGGAVRSSFLYLITNLSKRVWWISRRHRLLRKLHNLICSPAEPEATLGLMLLQRGHYTKLAEKHLRTALGWLPDSPGILTNLTSCLALQGKRTDAIEMCDRAIRFADPTPMRAQLKEYRTHLEKDDLSKLKRIKFFN